ncbi:LOW QUALITY PROTEIN: zf-CCHC domain-containing protein, partial [Cephalotus follicularis]
DTNKIIEQNNYTNRHLQTLGSQLSMIENIIQEIKQKSRDKTKNQDQKIKPLFTPYKILSSQIKQLTLNEINERLRMIVPDSPELDTPTITTITSTPRTLHKDKNKILNVIQEIETSSDDSVQEITKYLSATKIDPLKFDSLTSYYYRPTYPDLQIEERGKFTQASYQSGTIYEWNIDGINEYRIINKLQEMTMVSNAHKIRNNSDKTVANILIAGFTGQIKGWWDNVLTTQQQTEILEVIQVNELKEPILNNNETIEYVVSTLIYNIANYFVGVTPRARREDTTADQLSNLRCRKLQDFRRYKDTFMTKVLTREQANQPYWKEKFITGLPILFAEKIKNKYREKHKGTVPYEKLTHGDIVSTITKTILICYDIKMSKQIKKDSKTYKKELGDFCTQFGYETFKPPPSKNLQKQKLERKHYYKKQFEKQEYYRKPNKHLRTCYNCGKPGHIARYCKIRKQIKKLNLSEDHKNQIFKIIDNQSPEEEE